MLDRMTRLLPVLIAIPVIAFFSMSVFGQSPSRRTALAERQHLKDEVLSAMADGKISKLERAEILAEAKEVLNAKELEGLKETMDRLSPPIKSESKPKHSATERAIAASIEEQVESPAIFGRVFSHVPYIDDISLGPHPQVSKIGQSIPYVKPREIDFSGAKQVLAKAPRLSETYVEPPTTDHPLPKITRAGKSPSTARLPVRTSQLPKKRVIEKQSPPQYTDESVSPMPNETENSEPNVVQQPKKVPAEMSPLARNSTAEKKMPALATPAGALLPDRTVPSTNATYLQPVEREQKEAEFLR